MTRSLFLAPKIFTASLVIFLISACSKNINASHMPTPESLDRPEQSLLTLDRIYNSSEFRGERFRSTRWLKDGSGYTLTEKSALVEGGRDVVRYNPKTGEKDILIDAADLIPVGKDKPISVSSFAWSDDGSKALIYTNSKRVWRRNTQGDYWILDIENKVFRQLGEGFPASSLMFAKFSPDGTRVAYVQKTGRKIHDIYVENIDSGEKTRLTNDGSELIINGTFDWVYEEEFGLRDGFRWSPDGTKIAYWQLDTSGVRDFTLMNNTDSLYPKVTTFSYPKVGETNPAARLGVVAATGGNTEWMNIEGDPRNNYIAWMDWAANSDELIVQQLNRRQNTNTLLMVNAGDGSAKNILTDQDAAWLDPVTDFKWFEGGNEFLWVSENNGWRQVFRVSRDGKAKKLITAGNYDVVRIRRIDMEGGYIYFDASPDDPQRMYLYRTALDGNQPAERLTPSNERGTHRYSISHDSKWAFHFFSARDKAQQIEMVSLPDHAVLRNFVTNEKQQAAYDAIPKGKQEFFQVTLDDGQQLEGFMRFPPDFDPAKKYPVIFFVYGEPAGMTANDRWNGNNMLWHIMMTQKGYIFATIDNRGQPTPKGRAWRKSIYRKLGLINVDDQASAAKKLLAERPYMDPTRIGIWGHSGGGTSTLHALFRHGDVFSVGVARAPVPDLRLYDTIYQERYSGILPEDADYYEKAAAITYADQLKGKLLLVHGTGDDNVHYQGSERLANKLIEHNIQFDFMAYPNRTHGIREGKNTTRHLMRLQTEFFLKNLPAGGR